MTAQAADSRSLSGYIDLVRANRRFRLLWYGQIVSLLGDWFNLIASATLIGQLTDSGLAVGGLFVVRMLAPFLVSPFAGVAADRTNRKHLLILADVLRAVTVLGFLLVRRPEQVWLLYTLTAVQLGLSGVFFPARNAILPDLVERRELGVANALSSATWSVMLGIGAALGGFAAGQLGAYPSFVIDAATFVLSAVLIWQIRYEHVPALQDADSSALAAFRQYVDGLKYLWKNTDIFLITLHKPAVSLFISGGFQVVQVIIAEQLFVIGAGGGTSLGLMYALVGIGTGVGPIAARAFTGDDDRLMRRAILISYVLAGLGLAISAPLTSFPIVLAGTFLRGIGAGISWVFSTQLLLMLLPDRVRGRVFGTEFALQTLMNAIGAMVIGSTLDLGLTVAGSLWGMAALTLIPAALWGVWMRFGRHAEPPAEMDDEVQTVPVMAD